MCGILCIKEKEESQFHSPMEKLASTHFSTFCYLLPTGKSTKTTALLYWNGSESCITLGRGFWRDISNGALTVSIVRASLLVSFFIFSTRSLLLNWIS